MTDEQIETLAEYLTNTVRVTHHSMSLELRGRPLTEVRAFFALLAALASKEEAGLASMTKEQIEAEIAALGT